MKAPDHVEIASLNMLEFLEECLSILPQGTLNEPFNRDKQMQKLVNKFRPGKVPVRLAARTLAREFPRHSFVRDYLTSIFANFWSDLTTKMEDAEDAQIEELWDRWVGDYGHLPVTITAYSTRREALHPLIVQTYRAWQEAGKPPAPIPGERLADTPEETESAEEVEVDPYQEETEVVSPDTARTIEFQGGTSASDAALSAIQQMSNALQLVERAVKEMGTNTTSTEVLAERDRLIEELQQRIQTGESALAAVMNELEGIKGEGETNDKELQELKASVNRAVEEANEARGHVQALLKEKQELQKEVSRYKQAADEAKEQTKVLGSDIDRLRKRLKKHHDDSQLYVQLRQELADSQHRIEELEIQLERARQEAGQIPQEEQMIHLPKPTVETAKVDAEKFKRLLSM